ncbi:bifunctional UDP-3-O-[3-hydroxymyristoyl] N-acetylglucosamine deacetylase/3-hydroxyacyl-ACP dehydratase [bacterium]|nr:bifunctional UDP-3-O-[3-hydroxymyristoyl] N-acetylglucosamine deacetylase/3-hydroxyacyl-ACP dehydratase [bacterium]
MSKPVLVQTTLAKPASLEGIGLHTGVTSQVVFEPAPADTGYVIVRTDLPGEPRLCPAVDLVSQTTRGTTLKDGDVEVHTVEHVLAALVGLDIDNCIIKLSAFEPPVMDGSSQEFSEAMVAAGIVDIPESEKKIYRVTEPLVIQDGKKSIAAWPYPGLRITYELYYDHPWLQPQRVDLEINPEVFRAQLAQCRTFCLEQEIDWLKSQGLAKGGTRENALVIGEHGLVNPPFRCEHELAFHKVLDFIGDLALARCRVEGHFVANFTGHEMNARLVKALLNQAKRIKHLERGKGTLVIEAQEIEQLLPHRYPMLLVDRVIDLEVGKRVVGIKNVTMNEHFFQGHFPGHPIMPGVLILEAMAQCGGVLLMKSSPDSVGKVVYFVGIDKVRFRKPVVPGDQLRFELSVDKIKARIAKMLAKAYVGDTLVCEAEFMSTLVAR